MEDEVIPLIDAFARSLIKKLYHKPVKKLRLAARNNSKDVIRVAEHLFLGDEYVFSEKKNEKVKKG